MILRRTVADAGLSTNPVKEHYKRPRPFVANQTPTLIPDEEEAMLKVSYGSYPSGHTAVGWAWVLILTELFPDHADVILKRGWEYGISRMVCNVHWHSDVVAGRTMGAATVWPGCVPTRNSWPTWKRPNARCADRWGQEQRRHTE